MFERLSKWTFLISFLLMILTSYYKDNFPPPDNFNTIKLTPPVQSPTTRAPFSIEINQQHYLIIPKFNYELTGVVVTYNNAGDFGDIWHHDIWKDFLNVRDLCVIWGSNVSSGIYRRLSFSSDTWTCWVEWPDSATKATFQASDLSNNHILTANNQVKAVLLSAEKGDVIHFKGVLAEYRNDREGFFRGTSINRIDTGNGACETVYIDEFKVIKKANHSLRNFYQLTKWIAIFSFICFLIMFAINPLKVK